MGGSKKKSPAQQDKTQSGSKKDGGKKSKKKSKDGSSPPKAEIPVILKDEQAEKFIKNAKVITILELARQAGVKASAANAYLRAAREAGKISIKGGHSGHWIYESKRSVSTSPEPSKPSSSE